MAEILNESVRFIDTDDTLRRKNEFLIIAKIESLVPLMTTFNPSVFGGGNSKFTWEYVQQFFYRYPGSRNKQLPMHYYFEMLSDDYVSFVGLPLCNMSWFLAEAVKAGVLPPIYADAVLIVTQDNYSIENIEARAWKLMSHHILTPLLRTFGIPRDRIKFFELIADLDAINSEKWNYRWRDPVFLDPVQLELQLKMYQK